MNREEYNKLFHEVGLNRVAFKAVNDCDEEILALVNRAIAAEREACAKVCEMVDYFGSQYAVAIRARGAGMKCERCGEVNPAEIHTCSPQREWQGLTDEDLDFWGGELGLGELGKGVLRAVDAHLREKNT